MLNRLNKYIFEALNVYLKKIKESNKNTFRLIHIKPKAVCTKLANILLQQLEI